MKKLLQKAFITMLALALYTGHNIGPNTESSFEQASPLGIHVNKD